MSTLKEQAQNILLTHLLQQKSFILGNVANEDQVANPLDIAMIQNIVPNGADQISVAQMRRSAYEILDILNSKVSMLLDIGEDSLAETVKRVLDTAAQGLQPNPNPTEVLQGQIHIHLFIGAPMDDVNAIKQYIHHRFATALQATASLIQCLNEVERLTSPEEAPAEDDPAEPTRNGLACPGCNHPLSVGDRRIYVWEDWQPHRGVVKEFSRIRLSCRTGRLESLVNGDALAQWVCPECGEKNPEGYVFGAVRE